MRVLLHGREEAEWDLCLDTALRIIRTTPHTATGLSPQDLMFPWSVGNNEEQREIPTETELDRLETDSELPSRSAQADVTKAFEVLSKFAAASIVKEKNRQKKGFEARNKGVRKEIANGGFCTMVLQSILKILRQRRELLRCLLRANFLQCFVSCRGQSDVSREAIRSAEREE